MLVAQVPVCAQTPNAETQTPAPKIPKAEQERIVQDWNMARERMNLCLQQLPTPSGAWRGWDDFSKMLDGYIERCGREYLAAYEKMGDSLD